MSIYSKRIGWGLGLLLLGLGVAHAEEATLYWANRITLSTLASGEVVQVALAGQRVRKGEALVTLQQSVYKARVTAYEAIVKNAREQRAEAKAELDRNQEMYDQSMLALHDLQVIRIAFIKADAEYQQARAELAKARFMQQQSLMTAPFNAIILKVSVAAGEVVNNQQQSRELMVIASSDKMLARATVDLDDALALKAGQEVNVEVNGKSIKGAISSIDLTGGAAGSSTGGKVSVDVIFPIAVNSDTLPGNKVDIDL